MVTKSTRLPLRTVKLQASWKKSRTHAIGNSTREVRQNLASAWMKQFSKRRCWLSVKRTWYPGWGCMMPSGTIKSMARNFSRRSSKSISTKIPRQEKQPVVVRLVVFFLLSNYFYDKISQKVNIIFLKLCIFLICSFNF